MIVNKPVGKQATQGSKDGKKKQTEHDIDIAGLERLKKGVAVAVDPNSDAWAIIAPPPAGYYAFVPALTKDGIKGIERTDGNPETMFFKVNIELKFQSPNADIQGAIMFANLSTYIGRGKELSTVLGIMLKSNKKPKTIPSPITDVDQLIFLKKWLTAQPLVYAYVDWQVWSKKLEKTLIKGMENFPQDEEGNYISVIEHEGETCNANIKVVNFITPQEFKQIQEELAIQGDGVTEADVPTIEEEKPVPVAKAQAQTKATQQSAPTKTTQQTKVGVSGGEKKVKNNPPPAPDLEMESEDEGGVSEDDAEISIDDFVDSDEA